MGVEQRVRFPEGGFPSWDKVRDLLAGKEYPVQVRMIDGLPAFPDEEPPASWRELRLGTPGGMVTVRREGGAAALVTWGNADAGLVRAWNALAWAFARGGGGEVLTAEGPRGAADFARSADLPPGLRDG